MPIDDNLALMLLALMMLIEELLKLGKGHLLYYPCGGHNRVVSGVIKKGFQKQQLRMCLDFLYHRPRRQSIQKDNGSEQQLLARKQEIGEDKEGIG